jgi:membrane protein implicated in regulation of membrane protease activity
MLRIKNPALLAMLLMAPSGAALAYIGPGAGISVLGSLLGILATFFVAVGAVLFWPLRKWMKRRKTRREAALGTDPAATVGHVSGNDADRKNH